MERHSANDGVEQRIGDGLRAWADEGTLSAERDAVLRQRVHRLARAEARSTWLRRPLNVAVAAVLSVAIIFTASPGARAWAAENLPVVGKFLEGFARHTKGWAWADEHGMLQQVMASATDQGYTLRIHSVLADQAQTIMIYSVEGPQPGLPRFRWDEARFDGRAFRTGAGSTGEIIDGVLVGSVQIETLPSDSGTLELMADQIGEVSGKWRLKFSVSREAIDKLTRTIVIDKQIPVSDGIVTLQKLVITPVQVKAVIEWTGAKPTNPKAEVPQIEMLGATLLTADGSTLATATSVSGRGGQLPDGRLTQFCEAVFDRIETLPDLINIRLTASMYNPAQLRVPLTAGQSAEGPGGQKVAVESVTSSSDGGEAVVSVAPVTTPGQRPFVGSVLDDAGGLNAIGAGNVGDQKAGAIRMSIRWHLPAGRKPVALVVDGFFTSVDIATVPVDLSR